MLETLGGGIEVDVEAGSSLELKMGDQCCAERALRGEKSVLVSSGVDPSEEKKRLPFPRRLARAQGFQTCSSPMSDDTFGDIW